MLVNNTDLIESMPCGDQAMFAQRLNALTGKVEWAQVDQGTMQRLLSPPPWGCL